MKAENLEWGVIASFGVHELTKPRSTGRPINTHEVRHKPTQEPDYDRMRDLVHSKPKTDEQYPE